MASLRICPSIQTGLERQDTRAAVSWSAREIIGCRRKCSRSFAEMQGIVAMLIVSGQMSVSGTFQWADRAKGNRPRIGSGNSGGVLDSAPRGDWGDRKKIVEEGEVRLMSGEES